MKTTDFINVYAKESNEKDPFVENFMKLERVIDSCKTLDQLRSAKEYAQLMYDRLTNKDQGIHGTEDVTKLYNQIFQKIKDKEAQLDMPVFEAADAERRGCSCGHRIDGSPRVGEHRDHHRRCAL